MTDLTPLENTVRRLSVAFDERRLRREAELIAVKDLAAAARHLGQKGNMKMRRSLLVGAIEAAFVARSAS